jgi:hypothetical protein
MAGESGGAIDWANAAKRFDRFQPGPKEPPPSEWLIVLYACAYHFRVIVSKGHGLVVGAGKRWDVFLTKVTGRKEDKKPDAPV